MFIGFSGNLWPFTDYNESGGARNKYKYINALYLYWKACC